MSISIQESAIMIFPVNARMPVLSFSLFALVSGLVFAGPADRMAEGRKIYESTCAGCHASGVMGAPVIGKTEDWEGRSELWEGVLMGHAEKGWLAMPARGGNPGLSDYDVDAAAEYMLNQSQPNRKGDY
ncbi:cytochrome c5 family protein [Parahaliea maris]|uniref:Cytochrome c5 family protein n=1 Tax=Parahaliea maris TaxID=2716870 RepID=A0A5C9A641_9GAMM|nr:c-type cytochrome [Parahaliea maris]TXS96395.1 cytochrome c5 family protein [Parahaliea maris]